MKNITIPKKEYLKLKEIESKLSKRGEEIDNALKELIRKKVKIPHKDGSIRSL